MEMFEGDFLDRLLVVGVVLISLDDRLLRAPDCPQLSRHFPLLSMVAKQTFQLAELEQGPKQAIWLFHVHYINFHNL